MKKALTTLASKLGFWRITSRLVPAIRAEKLLGVFTFHRITAQPDDPLYLAHYDRGMGPDQFSAQVSALRQNYEIISLQQFDALLAGKTALNRHSALLTFDDADSEFHSVVFPILRQQRLPAVVFAPTAFIGSKEVFWHLRVSNVFNHISDSQWEQAKRELPFLAEAQDARLLASKIDSHKGRRMACQRTIWMLDRVEESQAIDAACRLEKHVDCAYTLGVNCMNWDQLNELEANCISVESHTATHAKLTRVPEAQVINELKQSKDLLEKHLKKRVSAVCYPGGYYDERIIEAAIESGYSRGFTTRTGFCKPGSGESRAMAIPRYNMRGENLALAERYLTKLVLRH